MKTVPGERAYCRATVMMPDTLFTSGTYCAPFGDEMRFYATASRDIRFCAACDLFFRRFYFVAARAFVRGKLSPGAAESWAPFGVEWRARLACRRSD